jgi:hypothetical protein
MSAEFTLTGVKVRKPTIDDARLMMILWGDTGSGKTTLACTAPGNKLLVQFDPSGHLSVAEWSDVLLVDLSSEIPRQLIPKMGADDPYGIDAALKRQPGYISTIVVDSLTTYAYRALQFVVANGKAGGATMDIPGIPGYGQRNAHVLRMVVNMMTVADRHKCNLVFITHEGSKDETDNSITMILAKNTANQIGLRLNEIWHIMDNGKDKHTITVRPALNRRPMKSRMFDAMRLPSFVWSFDPATRSGGTIDAWLSAWQQAGGKKIALP